MGRCPRSVACKVIFSIISHFRMSEKENMFFFIGMKVPAAASVRHGPLRNAGVVLFAGGLDAGKQRDAAPRGQRGVDAHRRDQSLVPESPVGAQRSSRRVGNRVSVCRRLLRFLVRHSSSFPISGPPQSTECPGGRERWTWRTPSRD